MGTGSLDTLSFINILLSPILLYGALCNFSIALFCEAGAFNPLTNVIKVEDSVFCLNMHITTCVKEEQSLQQFPGGFTFRAGSGIRTRDILLGKQTLYH